MDNRLRILMTGAGAPGGPGILAALSLCDQFEIHVCDINPLASGILLNVDKSYVIPVAASDDFIPFMLALCLEQRISVILPLVTMELFKFAKERALFEEHGIRVLVSDYPTLCILNDKAKLLRHLELSGIEHPTFKIVNTVDSLSLAVHALGYPDIPVVVKPSVGNGSRGIRILDPSISGYDMLFNEKPNGLHSTLDAVVNSIGDVSIPEMVVSEYLPGDELTIDTVVCDGKILEIMIRSRESMRSGISTSGRFIANQEIEEYICSIIYSLEISTFKGNIGFQVKKSTRGKYLLLESNPRIQGTSVAALGCGVNLPVLAVKSAMGTDYSYTKSSGIYFSRYYTEVFHEF